MRTSIRDWSEEDGEDEERGAPPRQAAGTARANPAKATYLRRASHRGVRTRQGGGSPRYDLGLPYDLDGNLRGPAPGLLPYPNMWEEIIKIYDERKKLGEANSSAGT